MSILSQYDPGNYFLVLRDFPEQFASAHALAQEFKIEGQFTKAILAGMGGSALAGDFINDYFGGEFTLAIHRDYDLPNHLDTKTLVIAISYSGNTEETLSAFDSALARGLKVVAIASGGELLERAKKNNVPFLQLPQGFQPRQMLGFIFTVVLTFLHNIGLIPDKSEEIFKLVDDLDGIEFEDKARMFAEMLPKKVPVIYTTTKYKSVARLWKICFNENAKIQSFYNIIPEACHNEMVGYTNRFMEPHFIFLESKTDHPSNTKRIAIMKKMFQEKGMSVTEFMMHGQDTLTQLFSTALFGYWVSYYTAIMYKTDPTPVVWVEDFKKRMKE